MRFDDQRKETFGQGLCLVRREGEEVADSFEFVGDLTEPLRILPVADAPIVREVAS